eukprot:scaffold2532_cov243-Pinguiococcus_pyrenoidosus.AAC.5
MKAPPSGTWTELTASTERRTRSPTDMGCESPGYRLATTVEVVNWPTAKTAALSPAVMELAARRCTSLMSVLNSFEMSSIKVGFVAHKAPMLDNRFACVSSETALAASPAAAPSSISLRIIRSSDTTSSTKSPRAPSTLGSWAA